MSVSNRFFEIHAPKIATDAEASTRARQAIRPYDVLFSTVRPCFRNLAMLRNEGEGTWGAVRHGGSSFSIVDESTRKTRIIDMRACILR